MRSKRINLVVLSSIAGCAMSLRVGMAQDAPVWARTLVAPANALVVKAAVGLVGPELKAGVIPSVRLGAVDVEALVHEDRDAAARGEAALRYGLGRDVRVGGEHGAWVGVDGSAGGGAAWIVEIVSPGAKGIRVHLADLALPVGASVCVYSPDDPADVAGPYEGKGPYSTGEFWTPTRRGERVWVECRYEPGVDAGRAGTPRVDRIQHVYRDPTRGLTDQGCYDDVACQAAWLTTAKACAGIGFIAQNSLFCSGQLVNTVANDQTPYFLTSNQCVNSNAIAQTCEVMFDYFTSQCNGVPPSLASVPRAAGCTLQWGSAWADGTLLMIDGSLPAGRVWAGWSSAAVSDGSPVAGIHFPESEPGRISVGTKGSNVGCGGSGHIRGTWVSGPTGPGSAGGGLFFAHGNRELVGLISCGSSSCATLAGNDCGSMNAMYPGLAVLLNAGADDAFEPNDTCANARVIGAGVWNSLVVKSTSEDWYRIDAAPGSTVAAQVSFAHANGDIDVELRTGCAGPVVSSSTGQTGVESVAWTNTSGMTQTVYLHVYLASDTRNTYSAVITNGVPPGQGACCSPTGACSVTTAGSCAAAGGVYAGDLRTCEQACGVAAYSGPMVGIADGTGLSGCGAAAVGQVEVRDSFVVAGVGVGVRITHPYQGDLKFWLKHENTGTAVMLVDRPGVPQSPFGFANDNYGASLTNMFIALDGAALRYDTPVVGIDNVSGPWKPEGSLGAFAGEDAAGTWTLSVQDCAMGETGSVVGFALVFAKDQPPCYANCDGSSLAPVLTANDFQCFINRFAAASSMANCDESTSMPNLTANDFQCFINAFAAGCP